MPTTIRDVVVKITTDNTGLQAGLDLAKGGLKSFAAAAGTALGAATVAFGALTVAAVKSAGEIERFSKLSNATTTEFQRLAAAAGTVGIEAQDVADVLKDMNDRVGDFISTGAGPMVDFFERVAPKVGVTADQFRRLSGPEALQLYVDTLEKAGASQQDMTFYMEALSGNSTRLLPLLQNNGAELRRLADAAQAAGAVMSGETLAALTSARQSLIEVQTAAQGFTNQIIAEMAPALAEGAAALSDMAGAGGPLSAAVDQIAAAFGSLAQIVASPEFIGAATSTMTALINLTTAAAEGMIWLSENVDTVAYVLSGLAVAAAALGGPLTLVAGLTAAAVVALGAMKGAGDVASAAAYSVRDAEAALNAELVTFSQSTNPAARNESRLRVVSLKEHAQAALAAAQAELALASAQAEKAAAMSDLRGQALLDESAGAGAGMGDYIDGVLPDEKVRAASERIEGLTAQIKEMTAALKDMDASGGGGGGVTPTPLANAPGLDQFTPPASGGGGGERESQLDRLTQELASERELLEIWYQERLDLINGATDAELEAVGGRHEALERLEQEHAERMAAIDKAAMDTKLGIAKTVFGGLADLMQAGNKKLFNIGKAAAVASAVIDGYEAAVSSYKHGAKIGGPALGAVYAGISLARTAAMISRISSQSYGSGTSGATTGGGGSTSTGTTAGEASTVTQRIDIAWNGPAETISGMQQVIDVLNDAAARGLRVDARLVAA